MRLQASSNLTQECMFGLLHFGKIPSLQFQNIIWKPLVYFLG